jgi:hypothetical protein
LLRASGFEPRHQSPPGAPEGKTNRPSVVQGVSLAGTPKLNTVGVEIEAYSADTVALKYTGLPGNRPQTYKNFVAIWSATVIPWTAPPLRQVEIPSNSESGTVIIDGLTITKSGYIIGYGVGSTITTICASAVMNPGDQTSPAAAPSPQSVQINVQYVGTNSVAVTYQALTGYLPHTSDNWVGLWRGMVSPYNSPKPLGVAVIPKDSTEGTVAINNVEIGINSTYTLIYFMGNSALSQNNTMAAAMLTFNTSESNPSNSTRP